MKKAYALVGIVVLVSLFAGCATTVNEAPEEMRSMTEVVEVPGMDKDMIYMKANEWMVDTFKSAESVIQYSDKEEGIIKGKYTFTARKVLFGVGEMTVTTIVTIEAKEGRYRVTFDNATYKTYVDDKLKESGKLVEESIIGIARSEWRSTLESLKSAISSTTEEW